MSWFAAFCLTQAVEIPVYLWGWRQDGPAGWSRVVRVEAAFAASLLTHPAVNFIFPDVPYQLGLCTNLRFQRCMLLAYGMGEVFAWLTEAWFLHRLGFKRPLLWSTLANALSLGLGLLIQYGW